LPKLEQDPSFGWDQKEAQMVVTLLGLVSATLFGVFFGPEGELSNDVQEAVFCGLILSGNALHSLQIVLEKLCQYCRCWICRIV
jgi:hypothetical protein